MTRVLMLTERGLAHQRQALDAVPSGLELTVLRRPAWEALRAALANTEILISERNQPVSASMIEAAPALRFVLRLGSLTHDIDVAAARAAGIKVSAQPVLDSILGAEHVLMMALAVFKRLGRSLHAMHEPPLNAPVAPSDEDHFAFNWKGYADLRSLFGACVAVLGMGEIGVELARRLAPCRPAAVWYYKRHRYPSGVERMLGVDYASLGECLRRADLIISLLPYADETQHLLGHVALEAMSPQAVLVHAGSGGIVDEAALAEALRHGRIAGAALDTFEVEPLADDHDLLVLANDADSNLLLTPHVASVARPRTRASDFAEIERFLRGEALRYEVLSSFSGWHGSC